MLSLPKKQQHPMMPSPGIRSLLFLIFLLSSLFIFILCYTRHPSLFSPLPPSLHHISPNATFSFSIKVLAFDRFDSLRRCLRSLASADYGADRVALHIYLDHFREISNASDPLLDRKLREANRTLEFLYGFAWSQGEKLIHYRTSNAGLQAQWLEAWMPASDLDFAFVVEDDVEVSSLYYRYLKRLISIYYYDPKNYSPWIYGATLQRPRFVPGKHGNKLQLDAETHTFLYQIVGTWGQLLFPKPWKDFRIWYDTHKSKGIKPFLEGMVTNGWYKRMGENIWTPWFVKFVHSRDYYNIYTNFQNERALSISHREAGVNYGKPVGPDSILLDEGSLDFNIWQMQPLTNLKWYDFCFREVHPQWIVRKSSELTSLLNRMQRRHTSVVLVSLFGTTEKVTRNMLCHFEKLNIRNYILLGSDTEFLLDLARRGHPVICADELNADIDVQELVSVQSAKSSILTREILIKAHILKKCLENGNDAWVIGTNLLPLSNSSFLQLETSSDIFAVRNVEFLYARNSPITRRAWTDDLINNLKSAVKPSGDVSDLSDRLPFSNLISNVLKDSSRVRTVADFADSVGTRLGSTNVTGVVNGKKFVFWSSKTELDSVEQGLSDAGMWRIDGESSCTAVVCHHSEN